MIPAIFAGTALAAGLAITPSDGVAAVGPREPAWAVLGSPQPTRSDFTAASGELDAAWTDRRALENEAARARVTALIAGMGPVVELGQRDVMQRALFLLGVLDIDDVGGIEHLVEGVVVAGQRIPFPWARAISLSPGSAAPATADAAYAAQVYEAARTVLTQAGGVELELAAQGAGEVRVDGLPVAQPITLLPGEHSLSWHPVGADPVVLQVSVGGGDHLAVDELSRLLAALAAAQHGTPLDAALRARLHERLDTPAVLVSTGRAGRVVWLVDGPARWGKATFDVGVGVGGMGFASTDAPTVACDGAVSAPGNGMGAGALEASMTTGPVRLRAAGGVVHSFGTGFAVEAPGACATGAAPNIELVTTTAWGWGSVGRRFGLSATKELEPFGRVGGTGTHLVVQAGVALRLVGSPWNVDLRLAAGPAFNPWSAPGAHVGFVGGLETALSFGSH